MRVIGLTGNIGSGKSTVSRRLKKLGAAALDTDRIARDVVAPGTPGLDLIVKTFGNHVLTPEGELDRAKMGDMVFKDPGARAKLEAIVHPLIFREVVKKIDEYKSGHNTAPAMVVEVPLLIESGMHRLMDEIWLVAVNPEIQLNRIMSRDKLSPEQAFQRMNSQMPQEKKIEFATKIIENNGTPEETEARVDELWQEIARDHAK
ncbi:dephospho-CoA kinase [Desulfocucumis palustris]|uniref:Dephospho-CoA kinase n=1 Tax=Desulfocucumis palustris TaxID=1898651 RepID=A0A2L2XMA2_9FIRM|nr:dephospho-CoA kinase [Desulfocucumis palustris]GBF35456.1 dephospho-CoA kinase [Desulfocucumis palustris]